MNKELELELDDSYDSFEWTSELYESIQVVSIRQPSPPPHPPSPPFLHPLPSSNCDSFSACLFRGNFTRQRASTVDSNRLLIGEESLVTNHGEFGILVRRAREWRCKVNMALFLLKICLVLLCDTLSSILENRCDPSWAISVRSYALYIQFPDGKIWRSHFCTLNLHFKFAG